MADRAIFDLPKATEMYDEDLFVLEQENEAKKLDWDTFVTKTLEKVDGHGGILSIEYEDPVEVGDIAGTLVVQTVDHNVFTFRVRNGRGITGISKTSTSGLVDTYTVSYNDLTTSTFTVRNGEKGDKGDTTYVHIKYSNVNPTSDSQIGDIPAEWIGICTSMSQSAPTAYNAYKWYQYKGEPGDKGDPATVVSSVDYAHSDSGNVAPGSGWQSTVPPASPSKYLWSRLTVTFNGGDPKYIYGVSKVGANGEGSGSVTKVTVTNEGLDLMPTASVVIEEEGTIPIGHQNNITARTNRAVYPVAFDAHGHITEAGEAATADTFGAIKNPTQKSNGQYLKWNGTAWVADSINIPATGVTEIKVDNETYTGSVSLSAETFGAIKAPATKPTDTYLNWDGNAFVMKAIAESAGLQLVSCYEAGSTNNTFDGGDITLFNSTGCKFFIVIFCNVAASTPAMSAFVYPNGQTYGSGKNFAVVCQSQGWGNNAFYKREITAANNGKMTFTNGKSSTLSSDGKGWTTNDNNASVMVPFKIFGVK